MKVNEKGSFLVLIEDNNYRVTNITKFLGIDVDDICVENLDISEGLNIEEKVDKDKYIVIATLFRDNVNEEVYLKDCNLRSIETLKYRETRVKKYFKRIQEYYNCVEFARKVLIDIHNESKESEGYFITSESSNTRIFCYRGFEVEIKFDEDGQQFYFEFNGNEYSCGAFNLYPEEEIKWVIDRYLKGIPNA